MTKEELEKEARECIHNALFWLKLPINKEYVQEGGSYILKLLEPREKRIAELEAYNEKLLNGDIEKHNKIVELEAQIEKMKCCENCRWEAPASECDECTRFKGSISPEAVDNWELRRTVND